MIEDKIDPEVIELFEDEEDVIELQEDQDLRDPDLTFPCVLVSGLLIEDELEFLSGFFDSELDTVDLYVSFEGVNKKIGKFRVSLDNILTLRSMGYNSYLYLPDGTKLDLEDSSLYTKFIRL